ncbi:unnamed protein product [Amoebophrya sp. A25]|nr:unnamed protein product [Amoebophrya sp. A25]|eukprot:GSA25T00015377001.1
MHSGPISPNFGCSPRIGFKRTRRLNGEPLFLPLGNVDDFDFLFAGLCDEQTILVGLFVFPRSYLMKWGVCAQSFAGGQTSMTLYPPGCDVNFRWQSKREQAEEQKQFYIDLSARGRTCEHDKVQDGRQDVGTTVGQVKCAASTEIIKRFQSIILGEFG